MKILLWEREHIIFPFSIEFVQFEIRFYMLRCTYLLFALSFLFLKVSAQSVQSFQEEEKKVVLNLSDGELHFYPLVENALRVKFMRNPLNMTMPDWIYVSQDIERSYKVEDRKDILSIILPGIEAQVNKASGLITFTSPEGKIVLQESSRNLTPSTVQAMKFYNATQGFHSPEDECLFAHLSLI